MGTPGSSMQTKQVKSDLRTVLEPCFSPTLGNPSHALHMECYTAHVSLKMFTIQGQKQPPGGEPNVCSCGLRPPKKSGN